MTKRIILTVKQFEKKFGVKIPKPKFMLCYICGAKDYQEHDYQMHTLNGGGIDKRKK